ncbi:hypothetical protein ACSBR1_032640 [Camellia fascicularis]
MNLLSSPIRCAKHLLCLPTKMSTKTHRLRAALPLLSMSLLSAILTDCDGSKQIQMGFKCRSNLLLFSLFSVHGQVLITSWAVIAILLSSATIAVWNPQTVPTGASLPDQPVSPELVPDWAFEAASQEMRGMCQEAAYQPGLYLTATQVLLKPIVS